MVVWPYVGKKSRELKYKVVSGSFFSNHVWCGQTGKKQLRLRSNEGKTVLLVDGIWTKR